MNSQHFVQRVISTKYLIDTFWASLHHSFEYFVNHRRYSDTPVLQVFECFVVTFLINSVEMLCDPSAFYFSGLGKSV